MRSVLVTGGSGFVGTALRRVLELAGYRVLTLTSSDGDIVDHPVLSESSTLAVDHVFHLAAKTFVPDSWTNPQEYLRVNVGGTYSVLQFCAHRNIPLTYLSAYVYGNHGSHPIDENVRPDPQNPYSLSKVMAEAACEFFVSTRNLRCTIVRPFNVFGPGQNANFLVPSIVRQALTSWRVVVQDLTPKRDYLFIHDLIDFLMRTIQSVPQGMEIYNLGCGQAYSVAEVIDAVGAVTGKKPEVHVTGHVRPNEILCTVADIAKARRLGWHPQHSFEDGMARLIEHVKSLPEAN